MAMVVASGEDMTDIQNSNHIKLWMLSNGQLTIHKYSDTMYTYAYDVWRYTNCTGLLFGYSVAAALNIK